MSIFYEKIVCWIHTGPAGCATVLYSNKTNNQKKNAYSSLREVTARTECFHLDSKFHLEGFLYDLTLYTKN